MKKIVYKFRPLVIFCISAFVLSACKSKDEKIAILIKDIVKESLTNPDSYQSVEIHIDSLKNDRYGDTLIFDNAIKDIEARKIFNKASKNFYEKRDIIHGYLSSPSISKEERDAIDRERYKMDEYLKEMEAQNPTINKLEAEIKAFDKKCDGKFYGWLVTHKYNYVSKDGEASSGTFIFYIDKECSTVYRYLDEDKTPFEAFKKYIDMVVNGEIK
ncbi:hypothetical protein SAMN04487902_10622 [Prevotella sp. ne3005]|uniref:hypothetical protein n=1 Tax=Prevotella sp. ne3005 TaxID=1761887 RepID=UPI0008C3297E|nr:hypothetical protein [Prevotella sp. ne3005]SEN02312.1 hypothetical protein SAMN04487902_10622 [Prevotella sp. ne3005]